MYGLSHTNANSRSHISLYLAPEKEDPMRDALEKARTGDAATVGGRGGGKLPIVDFGRLFITEGSEIVIYRSVEVDALDSHITTCIQVSKGHGSGAEQDIYQKYGIFYSFYKPASLHIVGFACTRGDGTSERRTLICDQPLCETLMFAPAELLELAALNMKALAKKPAAIDHDHDDDDDDDDDLEFEEDEPEPLPASKPQVPKPSNLRPKKLVKKVPVKPVKKIVAKRPAMRLVKPFDPTL